MSEGGGAGLSTGAGTKVDVTLKLSQLQNLVKRDPEGYREDYEAQVRRLESECGILTLGGMAGGGVFGAGDASAVVRKTTSRSTASSGKLEELIQFAAATASSSYKGRESGRIAAIIIGLLVGEQPSRHTNEEEEEAETRDNSNNNNNNSNKNHPDDNENKKRVPQPDRLTDRNASKESLLRRSSMVPW